MRGGRLSRTPTQFWGEEWKHRHIFFGSDRLRIEDTWPLLRASHSAQVLLSPFFSAICTALLCDLWGQVGRAVSKNNCHGWLLSLSSCCMGLSVLFWLPWFVYWTSNQEAFCFLIELSCSYLCLFGSLISSFEISNKLQPVISISANSMGIAVHFLLKTWTRFFCGLQLAEIILIITFFSVLRRAYKGILSKSKFAQEHKHSADPNHFRKMWETGKVFTIIHL